MSEVFVHRNFKSPSHLDLVELIRVKLVCEIFLKQSLTAHYFDKYFMKITVKELLLIEKVHHNAYISA